MKKEKKNENNNNLKIKKSININFPKNKIIIDDYNFWKDKSYIYYSNIFPITAYEAFNLKSNKNNFYIAYPSKEDQLKIIKYNYSNLKEEEIFKLENIKHIQSIKYFYQPNSKKEYLFILMEDKITIYLILNEKDYKLINKLEKEGISGGYSLKKEFLPIRYFEIFYNEYNQKNILIVCFAYSCGCCTRKHDLIFYEFDEKEFSIISSFEYYIPQEIKFHLIYKDKIEKKYYLLIYMKTNLKLIEIKESKEIIDNASCDDIPDFYDVNEYLQLYKSCLDKYKFKYGCIVSENDIDYLYLYKNYGILIIIHLDIYYIESKTLKIYDYIKSMINYNNKYLIFGGEESFLIYDINCSQIISKYKFKTEQIKHLISINNIKSDDDNYNFLIIDGNDGIIKLYYY